MFEKCQRGLGKVEVLLIAAAVSLFAMAAVPNFVEMQIRSQVARSQRDLKLLGIAMEAYRNDNGSYPASEMDSPIRPQGSSSRIDNRLLTTPVAYIASNPNDLFRITAEKSGVPQYFGTTYRIYGVTYTTYPTPPYYYRVLTGYPRTSWMTWSVGPDWVDNTDGYRPLPKILLNEASASPRMGKDRNGQSIAASGSYYGIRYDPTNGAVSWGDIYRFSTLATVREN